MAKGDKTLVSYKNIKLTDLRRIAKKNNTRIVEYILSDVDIPIYRLVRPDVSNLKGRDPKWNVGNIVSMETII